MSKYTWVIDAGHGGVDANGNYMTDPKLNKRFDWPDLTILEGVVNRQIAKKVYKLLTELGIDFALSYHEVQDYALHKRTAIANALHVKKNCIFLSIHSNAGGGKGIEVFTSPGQTKSDIVADVFCKKYIEHFPEWPFRKDTADGDMDKEAKFTVLTSTACPAILVENFFFDERKQAELLLSEEFQTRIAKCLVSAIVEIENTQPV